MCDRELVDDEPPFGSFPEERGFPELVGMPFGEALELIRERAELRVCGPHSVDAS